MENLLYQGFTWRYTPMTCFHPIPLPRPGGRGAADLISVPCGKCLPCLQRTRADWSFRLASELKQSSTSYFITLTYDDNTNLGTLIKQDTQLFLKRLRKRQQAFVLNDLHKKGIIPSKNTKVSQNALKGLNLRFYLVGEYGTKTNRPHYHLILFNLCTELLAELEKIWMHGLVHIGRVTPASIHYVTKYSITKNSFPSDGLAQPFATMSRRPGLGSNYLTIATQFHKDTMRPYTVLPGGQKQPLPRYYKDRIFNKYEKEEIASISESIALKRELDQVSELEKTGESWFEIQQKNRSLLINKFEDSLKKERL